MGTCHVWLTHLLCTAHATLQSSRLQLSCHQTLKMWTCPSAPVHQPHCSPCLRLHNLPSPPLTPTLLVAHCHSLCHPYSPRSCPNCPLQISAHPCNCKHVPPTARAGRLRMCVGCWVCPRGLAWPPPCAAHGHSVPVLVGKGLVDVKRAAAL